MRVVVLTGAGISAESGVPTFRDANGLWEGHRVEEVATPAAFETQPTTVQRFYDARRRALHAVVPNAGHLALAALERAFGKRLLLVTQNIDDLHERAGSSHVVHMHGELFSALCRACGERSRWEQDLVDRPACPACGASELRPDVVWFGELPYEMDRIHRALTRADLFVSIGTSGAVYPAAGFVRAAAASGARTLELNLQRSDGTDWFHDARHGPASRLVPAWVKELL
ncbi:NAD-dependent protein deacylase [Nocardioides szechwanensis]|uniref:NAD-dependent protein deacylase n=1 Tax=Nocardioides szechwanensis TaxID=1005944 RepID=A0A1H0CRE6_9ACTN|nr:NAD-dependent deacylase [Nocardioides szechwanensis]GEP33353.1 NAD-dependent protein deacylase [Nocardioides szechwanensis]SDN60395.1 NAD-dependent deacetylase [Nocardioides szechwanensis]